ncbi:hypothetical protein [Halomonas alkalisoli]|uniref:hypothetical protein n=1 Tax=Halomonas alkalisoli TaxID=2907158 RepID=UPI001F439AEF|nr:hypothetical protein [Halomonas alkalisoli]MCE9681583.1 hypothetical protein [Halomonas alkalisoli]
MNMTQARCLNHLLDTYSKLPHDDLTFVINLLSMPSELCFRQSSLIRAEPGWPAFLQGMSRRRTIG